MQDRTAASGQGCRAFNAAGSDGLLGRRRKIAGNGAFLTASCGCSGVSLSATPDEDAVFITGKTTDKGWSDSLWMAIQDRLWEKAVKHRFPLTAAFELLPNCNLQCKMCYVRKSMAEVNEMGGLLTTDEWLSYARQARDLGMLYPL